MPSPGPADAEDPVGSCLTDFEAAHLLSPLLTHQPVLLAVSGGPDSMALMALAAVWSKEVRARVFVATVDHGLRAEAAQEAALVAQVATDLGFPCAILRWLAPKPLSGVQAAARDARYALLCNHARKIGARSLVTAHHADDQAETVLMRLVAGSGVGGLAGMRPMTERDGLLHVRPFLGVEKHRLVATCQVRGVPFVEDPGNQNPMFRRGALRRLRAALAADGLSHARLLRLGERAARAEDALIAQADELWARLVPQASSEETVIDWRLSLSQPDEARLRVLAKAIGRHGEPDIRLSLERLERCHAQIDAALERRAALRRTLAGALVDLSPNGILRVVRAPPRRAAARFR
jgi:tRNA(Ile)-lysidine synthase